MWTVLNISNMSLWLHTSRIVRGWQHWILVEQNRSTISMIVVYKGMHFLIPQGRKKLMTYVLAISWDLKMTMLQNICTSEACIPCRSSGSEQNMLNLQRSLKLSCKNKGYISELCNSTCTYGKLVFMTLPPFSRFLPICLTIRDRTERQTLAWFGSWMATPPLTEARGDRQAKTLFFISCNIMEVFEIIQSGGRGPWFFFWSGSCVGRPKWKMQGMHKNKKLRKDFEFQKQTSCSLDIGASTIPTATPRFMVRLYIPFPILPSQLRCFFPPVALGSVSSSSSSSKAELNTWDRHHVDMDNNPWNLLDRHSTYGVLR